MKIALDTSVLLPLLVVDVATPDSASRESLERLLARKEPLLIPMPVLAEALLAVDDSQRPEVVRALRDDKRLLAFDDLSALQTARLGAPKKTAAEAVGRQAMKWDLAIVACCLRHRVDVLCGTDEHFAKLLARGHGPTQFKTPVELAS